LHQLDAGERAAILLGLQLHADLLLIDERKGAAVAREKGLAIAGTLGILVRAARRDLIALSDAFDRLRRTTFHCSPELMAALLDHETGGRVR
jgi:predicted nucleic acid-binding protein